MKLLCPLVKHQSHALLQCGHYIFLEAQRTLMTILVLPALLQFTKCYFRSSIVFIQCILFILFRNRVDYLISK